MADKFTTLSIFLLISAALFYYGGLIEGTVLNQMLGFLLNPENLKTSKLWIPISAIGTAGTAVFLGIFARNPTFATRGTFSLFYLTLLWPWISVYNVIKVHVPIALSVTVLGIGLFVWVLSVVDYWTGVY